MAWTSLKKLILAALRQLCTILIDSAVSGSEKQRMAPPSGPKVASSRRSDGASVHPSTVIHGCDASSRAEAARRNSGVEATWKSVPSLSPLTAAISVATRRRVVPGGTVERTATTVPGPWSAIAWPTAWAAVRMGSRS